MARVNVETKALLDPRFTRLGRLLGAPRKWAHAVGLERMIAVWHWCTEWRTDEIAILYLEDLWDLSAEKAKRAIVDSELGDEIEGGAIQIRGCRKRTDWKNDDDDSDEAAAAPVEDRVRRGMLAELANGPRKRKDLVKALRARKAAVYAAVRQLLQDGTAVEQDGYLRLTVPTVPDGNRGGNPPVPEHGTQPGTRGSRESSSRGLARSLSLSPSPAPEAKNERESQDPHRSQPTLSDAVVPRVPDGNRGGNPSVPEPGTQDRNPGPEPVTGTGTREPGVPTIAELQAMTSPLRGSETVLQRRANGRALWEYQHEQRRRVVPDCPAVPLLDHPGGYLDELAKLQKDIAPADLVRALDVFAAEAEARKESGELPLDYFNGRTNWKREQIVRALAQTPEDARRRQRQKHRGRGGRGPQLHSMPPASPEEFLPYVKNDTKSG